MTIGGTAGTGEVWTGLSGQSRRSTEPSSAARAAEDGGTGQSTAEVAGMGRMIRG